MQRILLINYEYPPIGGGASNASFFIAKQLVLQGHEVTVVTSAYKQLRGYANESSVHVYRIPAIRKHADHSNILEMGSFIVSCFFSIGRIIKERKCKKAIIFFSIPCGLLGPFIKKKFNIDYVISLRGGDVPGLEPGLNTVHKLLGFLRRRILKKALTIVANSEGLAAQSQKIDPFPVSVIYNGVDTDFFVPPVNRAVDTKVNFLFVGRFQQQKNLFFLLDSIKRLKQSSGNNFVFHLVGDGPQKKELIDYSVKLDISDVVFYHNWKSKEQLLKMYQESHCIVNPSLYEGMPNVLLEAMACGLPIIASNVMGNNNLVRNGENGYLFDINNLKELTDVLLDIMNHPELIEKMGLESRKMASDLFSWKETSIKYLTLLSN